MKKRDNSKKRPRGKVEGDKEDNLIGYPLYPASEDIYNQNLEEKNIDPEDVSKVKGLMENENEEKPEEKDSTSIKYVRDLDVPGSELDDEQENVGDEDEENNYYSLGGDDHDDLEEDKSEL